MSFLPLFAGALDHHGAESRDCVSWYLKLYSLPDRASIHKQWETHTCDRLGSCLSKNPIDSMSLARDFDVKDVM
jgi:hypothetical protein